MRRSGSGGGLYEELVDIHAYAHVCAHACADVYTHVHAHIYAHVNAHVYTHGASLALGDGLDQELGLDRLAYCLPVCTGMHIGMRADMRVDICERMCAAMRIGLHGDVREDTWHGRGSHEATMSESTCADGTTRHFAWACVQAWGYRPLIGGAGLGSHIGRGACYLRRGAEAAVGCCALDEAGEHDRSGRQRLQHTVQGAGCRAEGTAELYSPTTHTTARDCPLAKACTCKRGS